MRAVWGGNVMALKADPKMWTALDLLGLSALAEPRTEPPAD